VTFAAELVATVTDVADRGVTRDHAIRNAKFVFAMQAFRNEARLEMLCVLPMPFSCFGLSFSVNLHALPLQ
jgi:hypothetical protein